MGDIPLTDVEHISWKRGIFAAFCVLGIWQTSVGLFFTAGGGEGAQQGPGECYGVSERLAQLPPSPLGWIAGDSTMSVTKTVSSNASETF